MAGKGGIGFIVPSNYCRHLYLAAARQCPERWTERDSDKRERRGRENGGETGETGASRPRPRGSVPLRAVRTPSRNAAPGPASQAQLPTLCAPPRAFSVPSRRDALARG